MVSAIAMRSTLQSGGGFRHGEDPLRRRRAVERAVPGGGDDHLDGGAAVVGDPGDVGDRRGGLGGAAARRWRGCARRRPTPRIRSSSGPRRWPAWRRWRWRPARRTRPSSKRCSSAASSSASASAGTFDGETNAVASTSRTPVATTASSSSSLADNGIGSSICRPSRRHTSRMVTWSAVSQHPLRLRVASSSSALLPEQTAIDLVVVLTRPRRARRCGWCPGFRRAPAPRRGP